MWKGREERGARLSVPTVSVSAILPWPRLEADPSSPVRDDPNPLQPKADPGAARAGEEQGPIAACPSVTGL